MLYTARLYALIPGMQDYSCGNISGAVMANKKLSVILNRGKSTMGVKRQCQGVGECWILSIMDLLFEGRMFAGKMLFVGGLWWTKVIHARPLYHVHTDKLDQTRY